MKNEDVVKDELVSTIEDMFTNIAKDLKSEFGVPDKFIEDTKEEQ